MFVAVINRSITPAVFLLLLLLLFGVEHSNGKRSGLASRRFLSPIPQQQKNKHLSFHLPKKHVRLHAFEYHCICHVHQRPVFEYSKICWYEMGLWNVLTKRKEVDLVSSPKPRRTLELSRSSAPLRSPVWRWLTSVLVYRQEQQVSQWIGTEWNLQDLFTTWPYYSSPVSSTAAFAALGFLRRSRGVPDWPGISF